MPDEKNLHQKNIETEKGTEFKQAEKVEEKINSIRILEKFKIFGFYLKSAIIKSI